MSYGLLIRLLIKCSVNQDSEIKLTKFKFLLSLSADNKELYCSGKADCFKCTKVS